MLITCGFITPPVCFSRTVSIPLDDTALICYFESHKLIPLRDRGFCDTRLYCHQYIWKLKALSARGLMYCVVSAHAGWYGFVMPSATWGLRCHLHTSKLCHEQNYHPRFRRGIDIGWTCCPCSCCHLHTSCTVSINKYPWVHILRFGKFSHRGCSSSGRALA